MDFQYELVDGKVQSVPAVWQKWLDHDPVSLVPSSEANLRRLRGFRFDCGLSDQRVLPSSPVFARALTEAGIPYEYENYDGNHGNRVRVCIETRWLPFFSDVLEFDPLTCPSNVSTSRVRMRLLTTAPRPFRVQVVCRPMNCVDAPD